jgi:UDP-N-acetylmuramate dehydrogenase
MLNIKQNLPLSDFTTLKIGGPAKFFVEVKNEEELIEALKFAQEKNIQYLIIGGGSNLLVSDSGFDGLIIKNNLTSITQEESFIHVQAGTTLQELVDSSNDHQLSGLQKLTGIPGTVGGAIYGNAGAYGQTISDHLKEVVTLNPKTFEKINLSKEECHFSYRDSGFKTNNLLILSVVFQLTQTKEDLLKESAEVLEKRLKKYKPGVLCPGSFFKNVLMEDLNEEQKKLIPEDRDYYGKVPAWFFLDEVGARNDQLGQIKISDFHGNLFMNLGDGTAEDFYNLAKKYFDKVKEKFDIELEPEVQIINLPPLA